MNSALIAYLAAFSFIALFAALLALCAPAPYTTRYTYYYEPAAFYYYPGYYLDFGYCY